MNEDHRDNSGRIDSALNSLLEQTLDPAETVLWADQPVPRFFSPLTIAQAIVGIFWFACVLLVLVHALNAKMPVSITWVELTLAMVFIPLLLFGMYFVLAPLREYYRTMQTVYAITDCRVITIRNRRNPLVRFYSFSDISQIRMNEQLNGVGDVIIVCGVRVEGETVADVKHGFYHIRRARMVAKRLESQVSELVNPEVVASDQRQSSRQMGQRNGQAPVLVEDLPQEEASRSLLEIPVRLLLFIAGALLIFGTPVLVSWATNTGGQGFVFFLMFSLSLLQIKGISDTRNSTDWPTTEGIIRDSFLRADQDCGYNPRVRYSYQVEGREYENSEISFQHRSDVLNRKAAEELIARYREGMPVMVYYHPGKPGFSVLEPGRGGVNWFVLAVLLCCCLAAAIWTALTWEGFDANRFIDAWQQVKVTLGR